MGKKRAKDMTIKIDEKVGKEERLVGEKPVPKVVKKHLKPKVKGRKLIRSKKYIQKSAYVEKNRIFSLFEAIELCKKVSIPKFDASLDLHLNLGLDKTLADQKIRTSLSLPYGTGKKVSLMAFVQEDKAKACREAGADFIGNDKTIEEILSKPSINFDKVVATPDFMPKLTKIAKILGPKGLMPSPKNGTVTNEPEKAIGEIKKGKLEIKTEPSAPIIHLSLGKLSFPSEHLLENFEAVIKVVKEAQPAKIKKDFLLSAYLSPTMGPSVKVDLTPFK